MTTNMTTKRELNIDALNMVAGGSIFHTEDEVTAAGIELWEVYGEKRGEFGYIYNTGDYYFKGRKLESSEAAALEHYTKKKGVVAPSVEEAVHWYRNRPGHSRYC